MQPSKSSRAYKEVVMGLDMYLYRRTYIRYITEHTDTTEITAVINGESKKFSNVSYITENVGYWRKANAIHKYFVDVAQGGEDDCEEHIVKVEDLQNLLDICKEIKKRKRWKSYAEEHLPTTEGFFFGPTKYDEYYLECIDETINILEPLLKDFKDDFRVDFIYESSW